MGNENTRGRVTIPTDVDVVPETLELLERWGADAIRDCDGTDYPEGLRAVSYTHLDVYKRQLWHRHRVFCIPW